MSEELIIASGDAALRAGHLDEFYVHRVNWLITVGRSDLIDEIADDCEQRRVRPLDARPRPVELGTRLAVATLGHTTPPPFGTAAGGRASREH